jgi:hypothetical protein
MKPQTIAQREARAVQRRKEERYVAQQLAQSGLSDWTRQSLFAGTGSTHGFQHRSAHRGSSADCCDDQDRRLLCERYTTRLRR